MKDLTDEELEELGETIDELDREYDAMIYKYDLGDKAGLDLKTLADMVLSEKDERGIEV